MIYHTLHTEVERSLKETFWWVDGFKTWMAPFQIIATVSACHEIDAAGILLLRLQKGKENGKNQKNEGNAEEKEIFLQHIRETSLFERAFALQRLFNSSTIIRHKSCIDI